MGYRQLYEIFCDAPGCTAKDVVASPIPLPVSSLHPTKNRNVVPDGWSKLYDTDSSELFVWCPEHGSHSASTAQRDEEGEPPEIAPIEGPQLALDGTVLHPAPPTPEGEEPQPWDCPKCGQLLAGCWGAAPFYCTTCEVEFEPALDGTALRELVPGPDASEQAFEDANEASMQSEHLTSAVAELEDGTRVPVPKYVTHTETEGNTVYALLADGRILSKAYENEQCARVAAEQTLRIQTEPQKMIEWFEWTVIEEAPHAV